jgi:hypothetical protein
LNSARRANAARVETDDDAGVDEIVQVTNEHALGDVGDAADVSV